MKKTLLVAVALTTAIGSGILTTNAFAQDQATSGGPMSGIVEKIATRFSLNKDDVQKVFDDARQEEMAKHEAVYQERLTQLVTDGKLTEAQKQLILSKKAELNSQRESQRASMEGKTAEERKAAMEAEKTALESWAQSNSIDIQYLMFGPGRGRGMPKP